MNKHRSNDMQNSYSWCAAGFLVAALAGCQGDPAGDPDADLEQSVDTVESVRALVIAQASGQGVDAVPADFDGDGIADLSVKVSTGVFAGTWFIDLSRDGFGRWNIIRRGFGRLETHAVPADYDGDGKADLAFKDDSGRWFIEFSAGGSASFTGFGGPESHAVPADYDGDGRADLAVKNDSTGQWRINFTGGSFAIFGGFGGPEFHAVPADYDGDGKADLAGKNDSTGDWYIDFAADGFGIPAFNPSHGGFGGSDFHATPADHDGDGKADLAGKNDNTGDWYIDFAADGFGVPAFNPSHGGWNGANLLPVPADYDGDGTADLAIYKVDNGSWQIDFAADGFNGVNAIITPR